MPDEAVLGETETVFDGRRQQTTILDRERLLPGNEISGPAILVELSSTLVIPPFARGRVDAYGNLLLDIDLDAGAAA